MQTVFIVGDVAVVVLSVFAAVGGKQLGWPGLLRHQIGRDEGRLDEGFADADEVPLTHNAEGLAATRRASQFVSGAVQGDGVGAGFGVRALPGSGGAGRSPVRGLRVRRGAGQLRSLQGAGPAVAGGPVPGVLHEGQGEGTPPPANRWRMANWPPPRSDMRNGAPPNQPPPGLAPPAAVAALPSPEARGPTKTPTAPASSTSRRNAKLRCGKRKSLARAAAAKRALLLVTNAKALTRTPQRGRVGNDREWFQLREWTLFRPSTCNRDRAHHTSKGKGMAVTKPTRLMASYLLAASSLVSCYALSCEPLVVGFHGMKLHDSMYNLLQQIKLEARRKRLGVRSKLFGWRDSDERGAEQYVKDYHKHCPRTPIVFIGHSYGGDSALDVAFRNRIIGVPDLLVTLDAVSHSALVPRYVTGTKWINIYTGQMPFLIQVVNFFTWFRFVSDSCDAVASLGGHWAAEVSADENFYATKAKDHCDVAGLFEPARRGVIAALSGVL